jgi:hypothetical protein
MLAKLLVSLCNNLSIPAENSLALVVFQPARQIALSGGLS